jgi:hypothetical protein
MNALGLDQKKSRERSCIQPRSLRFLCTILATLFAWRPSYSPKFNPGRTGVSSFLTACKLFGSSPSAFRIVGAT